MGEVARVSGSAGEFPFQPPQSLRDSSPMLRTGEPLDGTGSHWDGTGAVPYMKEGIGMEYTKAEYIRFIGELLELLPAGFVKKIYSIVANERRRAGV